MKASSAMGHSDAFHWGRDRTGAWCVQTKIYVAKRRTTHNCTGVLEHCWDVEGNRVQDTLATMGEEDVKRARCRHNIYNGPEWPEASPYLEGCACEINEE